MRERADGKARRTCRPPRSIERGTMICAIASLDRASPKTGSLAGKKLIFFNFSTTRAVLGYTKAWRSSAGHLGLLRRATFGHEIGNEARLSKCSDVNFGRPIPSLETAGRAIALRDGLHRVPPQLRVVAGDAHRHVAADIDGDGGDIAVRIRK